MILSPCISIIIMNFKLRLSKLLYKPYFSFTTKLDLTKYDSFPLQAYDIGQRLDRYLKKTEIGWLSAQKYLRERQIVILKPGGQLITENNYRIQSGDKLMVRRGQDIEQYLIGKKNIEYIKMEDKIVEQKMNEMLIFDNQNISILNKLPGYSVQGDSDPHHNIFSLMASRYKKDMIYISHRLDKPTTGLVLISKNLATAQLLGEALESRTGISKFYLALTQGRQIAEKKGTIANQIEWTSKHKARVTEYLGKDKNSQLAITNYVVMKQKKLSDILWRNFLGLKIITGRKHQIRCQLSQNLINPIINDDLYLGRRVSDIGQAIYLHSFALKVTSSSLIEQVFKISQKDYKLQNQKGLVKIVGNELHIYGKLPSIWDNFNGVINNNQLQQTMLRIQGQKFNEKIPKVMRLQ